jgi:LmbE family N-acetylglucosaminyl deacetylase
MPSTGPDVVVLSPHLDDAVLSLGATIGRMAAAGCRVEVWTAFTAGPDPAGLPRRLRPFGDYPVRIAEDDRALDRLGGVGAATPVGRRRLGLPERLWRDLADGARSPGGLASAFRTPHDLAGFSQLAALEAAVREALANPGTRLYAPLGIGRHTDHVEVAVAALRVALAGLPATPGPAFDPLDRVLFYEDFYAAGEAQRRRHPVSARLPRPWRESPGWAAPLLGAGLRALALAERGPGVDRFEPAIRDADWRCEPQPVDGFERAKLEAVAEYRSQLARMGGGRRVAAVLRRAHRVRGGELVWRASVRG